MKVTQDGGTPPDNEQREKLKEILEVLREYQIGRGLDFLPLRLLFSIPVLPQFEQDADKLGFFLTRKEDIFRNLWSRSTYLETFNQHEEAAHLMAVLESEAYHKTNNPDINKYIQLVVNPVHSDSMGTVQALYLIKGTEKFYIGQVLDNLEEFKSTLTYQINPRLKG